MCFVLHVADLESLHITIVKFVQLVVEPVA